jgi:hypothetical protein
MKPDSRPSGFRVIFVLQHWSEIVRVSTLLLALSGVGVALDQYVHLPPEVYFWSCVLGLISILALLIAFIMWLARLLVTYAKDQCESLLFPSPRFCLRLAEEEDLGSFFLRFKAEFGDEAPSMDSIMEIHRHNPQTFWKFVDAEIDNGPSKIRGTLKLLTLRKSIRKRLDAGTVNGRTLTTKDITKPNSRPAAIYVGGVIGDLPVRSLMMAQVVFLLYGYALKGIPIYARPLKHAGLRCLEKFGFEPVIEPGLGHIYRLDKRSLEAAAKKHGRLFRYFTKRRLADVIRVHPALRLAALG